jgi:prepilin-type processing-associated H-X9-DG protein
MRAGLGRVELIVILVIFLVAAGLIVTAVIGLRGKADLARCEDNLRQTGAAVHLFRDQGRPPYLPPSRLADGYATWAVLVAPYLDRRKSGALPEWDLSRTYFDQPDEVRQAQVPLYYCPSRRAPPQNSSQGDTRDGDPAVGPNFAGGLSDYACAAGTGDPRRPWTTARADGAMLPAEILRRGPHDTIRKWRGRTDLVLVGQGEGAKVQVRRAGDMDAAPGRELRRGTSQIILIGEKHVPLGEFGRADQGDGSVYDGGRPASFARIGGPGHGLARSADDPLDPAYPVFGSYHPRVCNFLMADGSVRPLTPSLSPAVLAELIARDGR